MAKLKEARVNWIIKGNVECPHCKKDIDFMEIDEFWVWAEPGQNVDRFHSPIDMTCEHCGMQFNIVGSDH